MTLTEATKARDDLLLERRQIRHEPENCEYYMFTKMGGGEVKCKASCTVKPGPSFRKCDMFSPSKIAVIKGNAEYMIELDEQNKKLEEINERQSNQIARQTAEIEDISEKLQNAYMRIHAEITFTRIAKRVKKMKALRIK